MLGSSRAEFLVILLYPDSFPWWSHARSWFKSPYVCRWIQPRLLSLMPAHVTAFKILPLGYLTGTSNSIHPWLNSWIPANGTWFTSTTLFLLLEKSILAMAQVKNLVVILDLKSSRIRKNTIDSTFKNISRIWLLITPQLLPSPTMPCFTLRNVLIWTIIHKA